MSKSDEAGALVVERRRFLNLAALGGAAVLLGAMGPLGAVHAGEAPRAGEKAPGPLPWPENALEPYLSARTISFHYGKHHAAYAAKTAQLTAEAGLADLTLEEVIKKTAGDPALAGLFNNAAQNWNHSFYWKSMKPRGGGLPPQALLERLDRDLGGFSKFAEAFSSAALGRFGSGWAWLVRDGDKLRVISTANAETPLALGLKPLLTIDVWEHAYYLDYQNRRADYIKVFLDKLVDWDFVAANAAG
ncbi:MAG: Fe-Mn family superoxide dismutase [Pseudomonadota bacterium]